ncbi:MAG: helix-turn-helix domain-containing protein [Alphaproteobacteria bacterium]|nr:helix-turn-helix domain-containing protein [Alphaproteobacteria bacterium]
MTTQPTDPDYVQSLARGLAVIEAFTEARRPLTLSDVARGAAISRAAARRMLHTLCDLGYVGSVDGKFFSLKPRVLGLGYAYLSTLDLRDVAEDHMRRLAEHLHESCSLSVLDGDDIVYVARVPSKRIMTIALTVGTRLPAYATSMGRVLLSGLPAAALDAYLDRVNLKPLTRSTITDSDRLRTEIRQVQGRGWAIVDQELEEGVRSVAVAIRDAAGRVVAAINLSAHATRVTIDELQRRFLPPLREAAAKIETVLPRRI